MWPQQEWFFTVIWVMTGWPGGASAASQDGAPDIAAPKPASPSNTSSAPVKPRAAASAASTPASAAWPECSGLLIASDLNACCSPAAMVAALASACAKAGAGSREHFRSRRGRADRADGPGRVPVPVVAGIDRDRDPAAYLVARCHRPEEAVPRCVQALGYGERGRDGRGSGMV